MKQRIVSAGFPQERTPARSRRSFRGFRTTALVSPPSPRRSSATAAAAAHRRNRSSCAGRPTTCSWSCLLRAHARGYLLLGSRRSGCLHDAEDRVRRAPRPPPDGFTKALVSPSFPPRRSRATAGQPPLPQPLAGTGVCPLGSRRSGRLHEAEDRSAASGPRRWSPPLPTQCLLTQKIAHIPIYANT
jgi:hypothetical protein